MRDPNTVFVLDADRTPLMPTRPARARRLLRDGKAAVYRFRPFTILLTAAEFGHPQIQAQQPLKDVAAINAIRYAIGEALRAFGLPVSVWTGGCTKFNRSQQGYPKDHWIDAACVGITGEAVSLNAVAATPLSATGRGKRQGVMTDRYGFPRGAAGRIKRVFGFQTGDFVRPVQPKGKYAGTWTGRLAGIRADGRLDIHTALAKVTAQARHFHLLQHGDSYAYA